MIFQRSLGLHWQAIYCEVIICALQSLLQAAFILYSARRVKSEVRFYSDGLENEKMPLYGKKTEKIGR